MKKILAIVLTVVLLMQSISFAYVTDEIMKSEPPIEIIMQNGVGWASYLEVKIIIHDEKIKANGNTIAIGVQNHLNKNQSPNSIWGKTSYVSDLTMLDLDVTERILYTLKNVSGSVGAYERNYEYDGSSEVTFKVNVGRLVKTEAPYNLYVGIYNNEKIDEQAYDTMYDATYPINVQYVQSDRGYFKQTELGVVETQYDVLPMGFKWTLPFQYDFQLNEMTPENNIYTSGMSASASMGPESYTTYGVGPMTGRLTYKSGIIPLFGDDIQSDEGLNNILSRFFYNVYTDPSSKTAAPSDLVKQFDADSGYFMFSDDLDYPMEYFVDNGSGGYKSVFYQGIDARRLLLLFKDELCYVFFMDVSMDNILEDDMPYWQGSITNYLYDAARGLETFSFRQSDMITVGGPPVPEVEKAYKISIPSPSITVFNNGTFNTGTKKDSTFTIPVKVTLPDDYDKEEKVYVKATIVSTDANPPIAINDRGNLVNESLESVYSDLSVFLIMTKGIKGGEKGGLLYNPKQDIRIDLINEKGDLLTLPLMFRVNLVDASPKVVFDEVDLHQIQSGANGVVNFSVKDPDSDRFKATISVPFGRIRLANGEWAKSIEMDGSPEEIYQVGFEAPEIGNFKLNEEMQALSMWALQKGTLMNAAIDFTGAGISKYAGQDFGKNSIAQRLIDSGLVNFDNYEEKMHFINLLKSAKSVGEKYKILDSLYSKASAGYNAYGILNEQGAAGLAGDIDEATKLENKGVLEAGLDIGVGCFSVVQSGVGLVTSVTNKIPGIGEVAGKTLGLFNLTIGVWKGNMQYLSKLEKIDRAKERIEMLPLIITVTDESGFKSRGVMMLPVVGMEI